MNKKLLVTFFVLLITGCTTNPLKNNILAIDHDGEAEEPGHTIFGTKKIGDEKKYITDLLADLEKKSDCEVLKSLTNTDVVDKNCTNKIVIYIHGGLNWPSGSVKKANQLTNLIKDSGYEPFFIDWRSGFWSTYKEHLLYERQGEYLEYWAPPTSPFILVEDLGRGLTRAPMRLFQVVNNFGKSILFGEYGAEKNAKELSKLFLVDSKLEKQCIRDNGSSNNNQGFGELPSICDLRTHFQKISTGVKDFAFMGVSFITTPIFDVLATSAWSTMKRRTETMFNKRICFDNTYKDCDSNLESLKTYHESREGVATKFFNALQEKQENENLEITLVGHSMGAIVANKILSRWPEIKFSKIVYLAPASTIEDFKLMVLPYMKNHTETKFYNLMLHPIAENTEAQYWGVGQTGSLLTQIDNHYESPTYEGRRTLGRWTNVVNNIDYISKDKNFAKVKKRLYFRAMPIGSGYPERHGDFDEVKFNNECTGKFWLGTLGEKIINLKLKNCHE